MSLWPRGMITSHGWCSRLGLGGSCSTFGVKQGRLRKTGIRPSKAQYELAKVQPPPLTAGCCFQLTVSFIHLHWKVLTDVQRKMLCWSCYKTRTSSRSSLSKLDSFPSQLILVLALFHAIWSMVSVKEMMCWSIGGKCYLLIVFVKRPGSWFLLGPQDITRMTAPQYMQQR